MKNDNKFRISGSGCSLVDFLYKPVRFSGKIFRKYQSMNPGDGGIAPGKLVFTEELEKFCGKTYRELRDEITGGKEPVAVNVGGPSVVSLVHASQILSRDDVEVYFYGCRGDDEAGKYIQDKIGLTPLKTGCYKIGERFTPFTDVLSDPGFDEGHGERAFINNIGAAWEFEPADLDEAFFRSNMVVFGGTALVPKIHNSLERLLSIARENGAITVVNTVYDFLSEKRNPHKPWPIGNGAGAYRLIDLLITDREEALRLSGKDTITGAAGFFRDMGVGSAIITNGPGPVTFYSASQLSGNVPLSELPVSERVRGTLINSPHLAGDTTGCGDNFTGGVIASTAKQMIEHPGHKINLARAVAYGIASGGFTCFYLGGTYFEKYPGEKEEQVNRLFELYLKQEKILF